MKSIFFRHFSILALYWWPWLKGGFYASYFLFIQISNSGEPSLVRFFVNTLFWLVAMGIIEISYYCLRLMFRKQYYKKTALTFLASYGLFATLGYYTLHGQNMVAEEVWNKQFEASWLSFFPAFNAFYWTFFKYGVILFLVKQLLLLLRLLVNKEQALRLAVLEKKVEFSIHVYGVGRWLGGQDEKSFIPWRGIDDSATLSNRKDIFSVKVGATTYMLDINNMVYLEVQDETTTVYQLDGSSVAIKIALSRFFEKLPKDRFVKIHDSRVVALPYIVKEEQGHLYVRSYENRGLKLGKAERFPGYKQWKENNRLK